MAQVRTVFTSDDKDVQKTLEKLQRETLQLRDKNRQLQDQTKKLGKESRTMFGDMRSGLQATVTKWATFAGAMVAANKAVSLLRGEYEALIERQQTAADRQVTLATAQQQALQNLGGDEEFAGKGRARKLEKEIAQIALNAGVSQLTATKAVSDALSARGPSTARQAMEAVQAALKTSPGAPENLPVISGSALDIQKATGLDPEQALGLLFAIGSQARVTNIGGLAGNVAPGMIATQIAGGGEIGEAGALIATISQGLGDSEGAMSRTSAVLVAGELAKRLPQLGDTTQRIKAIQQDPELRKRILQGGDFEIDGETKRFGAISVGKGAAKPIVSQILTPGTPLANSLAEAIRELNLKPEEFGSIFRELDKETQTLRAVQNASLQRDIESTIDNIRLSDTKGARSAILRDGVEKLAEATGGTRVGAQLKTLVDDFKTGGVVGFDEGTARVEQIRNGVAPGPQREALTTLLRNLERAENQAVKVESNERVRRVRANINDKLDEGRDPFELLDDVGEAPNLWQIGQPGVLEEQGRLVEEQTEILRQIRLILNERGRGGEAARALQNQGEGAR